MTSGLSLDGSSADLALSADGLRRSYSFVPSAVSAVCGHDGEAPRGLVVATLQPVSLAPALLGVLIQSTSTTWPVLAGLDRIGVSVFSEHQSGYARQLASHAPNRFAGVSTQERDTAVFVNDAAAWFEVSPAAVTEAGDHLFVLLEVHSCHVNEDTDPLVFHRSRFRAVKPWRDSSAYWPLDDVWQ